MFKKTNVGLLIFILMSLTSNAQEDAIRFFDLETRPTISILFDQTYKRKIPDIPIPFNIYTTNYQRRSINIAEQVRYEESKKQYLTEIYQSRLDQQQSRISQNYRSTVKTTSSTDSDSQVSFRPVYTNQAYGWQNNFYQASSLWSPSFYQHSSYGRLRANRFLFY